MLNVADKMMLFALNSNSQDEIVGLEDAAITKSARLAAGGELHEARRVGTWAVVGIDGDGDNLFATNHVAIAGGHVPHAPGDAFKSLSPNSSPRGRGDFYQARAFGYSTEF
jgi:hypothetical protein